MENIRNFVIIAHIDHGKSTLADRLLEATGCIPYGQNKTQVLDTMDLERERGITIKLQPAHMAYKLNGKQYSLNLIDTPGHVDFAYEVNRSLAACEGALLVVDASQGIQAQTIANLNLARKYNLKIIPVINKIDLPNAEPERVTREICNLLKVNASEIILASAKTGEGVDLILKAIIDRIPAPATDSLKPLRALVFDSFYDSYRGVVAYVRIVDGSLNSREKIKLMASGTVAESEEIGTVCLGYKKKGDLSSGEIGYIVTGLKDVGMCRVGDTITSVSHFASESLSGYLEPQPMVYAAIFTQNGEAANLRDALSKLKLNDASLVYEPTNSDAFGYGFRGGFLGLLHMEIVKERLEREYNLDLIVTTPSVAYKTSKIGSTLQYEEPWVELEIITPQQYVGSVMELAQSRRGIYKTMEYLADRVIVCYEAPLAGLIIDFYDQLKSVSQGYASLAYLLTGYRVGDLVKMDMMIAGDKIDVLSQIVPRGELMARAQSLTKKLKELIPHQMFEISIQAVINGKVIARESIPAMRKDVTAKLYGGDVTRKNKLLDKQKKGKKKMKRLGRIDIPSEVFINLLKTTD
ncbi:MAG: translation elongation factor 4 [bacterium]|nr:translation elongation factor 4 [bacterium]